MTTNKIDSSHLNDPRALAQFQQTRLGEAETKRSAQAEAGAESTATTMQDGERLEISSSAQKFTQMKELLEAGHAKLDEEDPVRLEKMETVKRRLQSGAYGSAEVQQDVAGRLANLMEGLDNLLE